MSASWPSGTGPAVFVMLLVAGCLAPAAPSTLGPASMTAGPAASFSMTAKDCEEAGFIAAYGSDSRGQAPTKLADVWELADIREEIGNPVHDAVGKPVDGPLVGNWHMGFRCASATSTAGDAEDYLFGYIGDMVKPPAWDTGGADFHFLLSGLGFGNGSIADALRLTTTADITPAAVARVDWYIPKEAPRSAAYAVYIDAEKGVYESYSDLALLRNVEPRTIRLWWQVPVNGTEDHHAHHNAQQDFFFNRLDEDAEGVWNPVYWDLHVSGGPQYTTPPMDGVEVGAHNKLNFEHGPVVAQPTLTAVYEYADVTFSGGHVLRDVTLTKMWNH